LILYGRTGENKPREFSISALSGQHSITFGYASGVDAYAPGATIGDLVIRNGGSAASQRRKIIFSLDGGTTRHFQISQSNNVTALYLSGGGGTTNSILLRFKTGSSGLEIASEDGSDTRLFSNAVNTGIDTTGSAPYASTYGSGSVAAGTASFAEGIGSLATGFAAHAAGFNTTASGQAAFSMGIETDADGTASFAVGSGSLAKGEASVAMGIGTIASASGQVTIGHYNFPLDTPDNLFVVGGGTGPSVSNRGNLLTVVGGIGSTYKAVKIDVGTNFNSNIIPGFSIYGNTTFQGNITGSTRTGGSNIVIYDDTYNAINSTSSFSVIDADRVTYTNPDLAKITINRFGINFELSDNISSPGSTYLWTTPLGLLYYGSNAIILNGGNTLGGAMTIGTNDINNLQLETNNSTRLFISSSGNVGIGTTTPTTLLHVSGTIANPIIVERSSTTSNVYIQYKNATTSWYAGQTDQNTFGIGTNAALGASTIFNISSSGNVGIGTTTPTNTLNVNGTTFLQGGQTTVRGSGTTSATTALRVENSAGTPALIVRDDGNIGIGTTSPQAQLHVTNSLLVGATSTYFGAISTNPIQLIAGAANNNIGMRADAIYMYPYGSTTTLHFGFNGNSAWRLINQNTSSFQIYNSTPTNAVLVNISSSGNVGIGNSFTNPSAQLHISGASNSGLLEIDSPTVNNIIYVSGSGNVGIGTGTPSAKLHVNGDTILSGSLYTYGANTDIDSGSLRTVLSVSTGSYRAAFFDYVLTSGSNARAGTVFSVWQGTSVEYADTSTNDIGNTNGVNLLVSMSGANIGLFASSSNDNWSMKALARLI